MLNAVLWIGGTLALVTAFVVALERFDRWRDDRRAARIARALKAAHQPDPDRRPGTNTVRLEACNAIWERSQQRHGGEQ